MDNVTRSSKSVTYTILDGIMSVATLLISIAIFEHFLNGEFSPYMFIILFLHINGFIILLLYLGLILIRKIIILILILKIL